jgi:hypothetical protein
MQEIRCKRCIRVLISKESIKLGYGRNCYRIIQLTQESNRPNNDIIDHDKKCVIYGYYTDKYVQLNHMDCNEYRRKQ